MKLRFVTLDSVAPIYFPLILHKPLLGLLLGLIRLAPTLGAMLRDTSSALDTFVNAQVFLLYHPVRVYRSHELGDAAKEKAVLCWPAKAASNVLFVQWACRDIIDLLSILR